MVAISTPTSLWIDSVIAKYTSSPELQKLKDQFKTGDLDLSKYTCHEGILLYKGRIYIDSASPLRTVVLQQLHDSPVRGHSGFHKTLKRARTNFF